MSNGVPRMLRFAWSGAGDGEPSTAVAVLDEALQASRELESEHGHTPFWTDNPRREKQRIVDLERAIAILSASEQLLAVVRAAEKLDGVWKHTIETITAAEVNARIVANREALAALPPEVRAMVEP